MATRKPANPKVASTPEAVIAPEVTLTDEIAAKLAEIGVTDEVVIEAVKALGVNDLSDFAFAEKADLVTAGLKPIEATKLIRGVTTVAPVTSTSAPVPTLANTSDFSGILPTIPDDGSWLEMLKTGGVLKVDQSTVIAAVRAALADRVKLFDLPEEIAKKMEAYAEENDDPVDSTFFKLRQQLTRRSYAEIFSAIEGLDGTFVSPKKKSNLLGRINSEVWPAIAASFHQLKAWQAAWMQGVANPSILLAGFLTGGSALPPGMVSTPDTGALHDSGDDINNAINKAFAGTGTIVASALAYDAVQIRRTLEDPRLPALLGAPNRDQMLKRLGVTVSANYARLETNLVKYILGFIQAKDVAAGDEELRYFSALYMLGSQIDWSALGIRADSDGGLTGLTGERL